MIIPDGETIIEANDHVIAVAYTRFVSSIRKLFKEKR
jgi:Trk K+ transport system NAD-binding subunit